MRKFWGFYDNGKYKVGCNGATIYVFDQNDNELKRFKDIRYAYRGTFMPGTNIFVAKSTEGSLAVYDMDKLCLVKKIVITRDGAQDEGFSFSTDNRYFYNIEKPIDNLKTRLAKYNTVDFSREDIYFDEGSDIVLETIEVDKDTGCCYILGFMRNDAPSNYRFIGIFDGEKIKDKKMIDVESYDYLSAYKSWEESGFTSKKLEWSRLNDVKEIVHTSLKEVYENHPKKIEFEWKEVPEEEPVDLEQIFLEFKRQAEKEGIDKETIESIREFYEKLEM